VGYSLKFEHPHFPEGKPFAVGYLGVVENGGTLEVDEDAERMFVANNGISVEDAFNGNGLVTVSGSSALSQDEVSQLIEQANPAPTSEPAPDASEASNDVVDDPNALILGGENS
jgi:hypothetical protein